MIKVCHVTSVHNRYDGRIFQRACRTLAEAGYDVTLLVGDGLQEEEIDNIKIRSELCSKSRIKRIFTSSKMLYNASIDINAEIYHLHDPELLPLAKKLYKHGKKVIFDSHENYFLQINSKDYIPKSCRKLIANLYKLYETSVISRIDATIMPSTIKNGINIFEGRAKKTVFVDNRPRRDLYYSVAYNTKNQIVKCCQCGSITKARGIEEIIRATYETNTPLVLGGNFDIELLNELKEKYSFERIDLRGQILPDEIQKVYDECHIGLSIIHNTAQYALADNIPTKIYEYMMAGIPFIASDLPGMKRFIEKYPVGILVNPENIEDIKNAIIYLKEHPNEACQMGALGRKVVLEELCWEKESEKLLQLYEDLSKKEED